MKVFTMRKRASAMAMGIALATGAVAVTGAFGTATEAQAQRKKKAKTSKEFNAAYNVLVTELRGEANPAALTQSIQGLLAVTKSQDEQNSAGRAIFEAAAKANSPKLQLQGVEMVLNSGMAAPEEVGRFNYIAHQISIQLQDFPRAGQFLQRAIDLNFAPEGRTPNELRTSLAEIAFSANDFRPGLAALKLAIDTRLSQGLAVDQAWYRRGLSIAYNNKILPDTYDWLGMWIGSFPSEANWRDAINITRNLSDFERPEMLDLMRLSKKVGSLDNRDVVTYYVESADARRLPLEVKNVIEGLFATDAAARDDIYLNDQLAIAKQRIPADRPELPELAAEADATTTDSKIVMVAGDTFYSYGEYDKAERFFTKASAMPGAETQVALTRLGMTQIALGKFDEAKATLAKVSGERASIAALWSAYANQMANGG